ncbi:hypothetical protein P171DRAFT_431509 [Karstenula rhodostoma CBS 690.94]|uniref:Uncharacterized protein n=1 Tax=Karstenula rhodostoma CBS 690.94 TaxID=1392251 RepID=A0A9P4PKQ5_9PLEO|nr:hypothetical protein P171DRAFT_431509 [Karstenula rhodostoma CBS 690.94]
MQPLGHTPSPGPKKRGKGAMKKQKLVAPEPPASGDIQAARERSFKAVAPSATAAVRLGQHLQNINGNQINVGRDPRRRAQAGERHDASSSPAPASAMLFGPVLTKQEEAACEPSDQPQIKLFAPATTIASSPQRAESVPYYPMVGRGQLHRPVSTVGVLPNTLAVRPKQLDSDSASDSEARIRELEDKNLSLRKAGFCKDREIRKLKAELRKLGIRTSATHDAAFETSMKRIEAGIKRPRSVEDVGGPVMEP